MEHKPFLWRIPIFIRLGKISYHSTLFFVITKNFFNNKKKKTNMQIKIFTQIDRGARAKEGAIGVFFSSFHSKRCLENKNSYANKYEYECIEYKKTFKRLKALQRKIFRYTSFSYSWKENFFDFQPISKTKIGKKVHTRIKRTFFSIIIICDNFERRYFIIWILFCKLQWDNIIVK